MTYFEYIFQHLFPTWIQTWAYNFQAWADLMTDNYSPYDVFPGANPKKECHDWFWISLQLDDTYPKKYLEKIFAMAAGEVKSSEVKPTPSNPNA